MHPPVFHVIAVLTVVRRQVLPGRPVTALGLVPALRFFPLPLALFLLVPLLLLPLALLLGLAALLFLPAALLFLLPPQGFLTLLFLEPPPAFFLLPLLLLGLLPLLLLLLALALLLLTLLLLPLALLFLLLPLLVLPLLLLLGVVAVPGECAGGGQQQAQAQGAKGEVLGHGRRSRKGKVAEAPGKVASRRPELSSRFSGSSAKV